MGRLVFNGKNSTLDVLNEVKRVRNSEESIHSKIDGLIDSHNELKGKHHGLNSKTEENYSLLSNYVEIIKNDLNNKHENLISNINLNELINKDRHNDLNQNIFNLEKKLSSDLQNKSNEFLGHLNEVNKDHNSNINLLTDVVSQKFEKLIVGLDKEFDSVDLIQDEHKNALAELKKNHSIKLDSLNYYTLNLKDELQNHKKSAKESNEKLIKYIKILSILQVLIMCLLTYKLLH